MQNLHGVSLSNSLAAVLFLLVFFLPACASRKSEPIQRENLVLQAEAAQGQQHFMRFCQKCHPGGQAGLGPSITAVPAPMFLKKFQVRHGLGVMPAFSKEVISRKELREIASYLKALKRF
jgi:mono/diheme cytochrome c family protein